MAVIWLIIEIIVVVGMIVGLYQKNTNRTCKSKRRLDGKTAIVTGGTRGMGLEIAKDVAGRGAKVIITCPYEDEGLQAENSIKLCTGNENVIFKFLDLSSFASVRQLGHDILESEDRLDILVNNAGVACPADQITADGLNYIMQVNYHGTFLLTVLLLPLLKKSGTACEPSRIINTASISHMIGKINFVKWHALYYYLKVYADSKMCVVLFTLELAKRVEGSNVVVNMVDPGLVGTNIFQCAGWTVGKLASLLFVVLFKNPWEGAQTAIYAAVSEKAGKVSGEYFKNCQITKAKLPAHSDKLMRNLWDESVQIVS